MRKFSITKWLIRHLPAPFAAPSQRTSAKNSPERSAAHSSSQLSKPLATILLLAAGLALSVPVQAQTGPPTFGAATVIDQTYTFDMDIGTVTLPVATGGTGAITYSLEALARFNTLLPSGLVLNANSGTVDNPPTLTGTPAEGVNTVFSYVATDTALERAALPFRLVINTTPHFGDQILEELTYALGVQLRSPTILPAATLGPQLDPDSPEALRYAITLTSGQRLGPNVIAATTGRVANVRFSGTPGAKGRYHLILRGEQGSGSGRIASFRFFMNILDPGVDFDTEAETALGVESGGLTFLGGEAVNATLPAAISPSAVSYTLLDENDANLEAAHNLTFNSATRTLVGQPSSSDQRLTLTYTASDGTLSDTLTFSVTLQAPTPVFSPVAVTAKEYSVGVMVALTLPEASNSLDDTAVFDYALTPDLEQQGLTFSATDRTLTGIPTEEIASTEITYTATQQSLSYGSGVGSLNFTVAIKLVTLIFDPDTVADQTFMVGVAIDPPLTLPEAKDGEPEYTYTLGGSPDGLDFDATTRVLSGTPSAAGNVVVLTFDVSDSEGNSIALEFNVEVAPNTLAFADDAAIADQSYTASTAITTLELPTATGGIAPLAYTLSSTPPASLSFANATDTDPPTLSGTPDAETASTEVVYTVTDSSTVPLTATLTFNLFVAAVPVLSQDALTYTAGFALQDLPTPPTLPEITSGGIAPILYTLGGLPTNLSFDPASRALIGTADEAGASELTFDATDSNDAVASVAFTLTINEPLSFTEQDGDSHVRNGETYRVDPTSLDLDPALTLPEVSGGDGTFTTTLTGPAADDDLVGLTLDLDTFILSGTLEAADAGGDFVLTITDGSGAFITLNFAIRSSGPYFDGTQGNLSFVQNMQASETLLVADTSQAKPDAASVSYTLLDASDATVDTVLPGLTFDPATRTLSGIPTVGSNPIALTYTVSDGDGNIDTEIFNVEVTPNTLAFADDTTIDDQSYTAATAITLLQLPSAMGGIGALTYTLSGDLPASLSFADATDIDPPTLSGTPDAETASTEVVYTVTDSSTMPLTASLTFNIFVAAAPVLSQDALTYTAGFALQDLPTPPTLPEVTSGGVAPFSYTLGGLPANLNFDSTSRTLTGAADAAGSSELTFGATDSNDAAAVVTFTLTMNALLTFTEQDGDLHVRNGGNYRVDTDSLDLDPALTLPAFGGGDGTLTTALTGPAGDSDLVGLVFDEANRILSGTLESASAGGDFVWTITDGSGAFATLNFAVRGSGPYFETTQGSLTFVQGEQGSVTLLEANVSEAKPDAASVTYTLLDADDAAVPTVLPGLAFDPATRILSGTSAAGKNSIALTYTVSDGDGNIDTEIFNVEVTPGPLSFASDANIADQSYTATATIDALELPTATGGIADLVYTLSSIPAGLSYAGDTDPPTLSGAPDAATANTQLVYTVTDSSTVPLSATLSFNIFVAAPPVLTQGDLTHTAGFALQDLPNAPILSEITSGGIAPISYTLGGLPASLVFDPTSRALSGAADAAGSSELTFGATDSNDAVAVVTFTLTMNALLTFTEQSGDLHVRNGESYRVDPDSLALDPVLTLPAFGGGDGTLTTALTGPAGDSDLVGLVFDEANRILSGTLESASAGGDFVWTITDGSGAFITLNFAIRSTGPYFAATQGNLTFVQGTQASETLLEADISQAQPDAASVSYTLLDADDATAATVLPGLAFASATRTLSGTPTAGTNPIALTYTVSDGEGNIDIMIFNVEIIPNPLSFASGANIADQSYTATAPITPLQLPIATGGIAALVYTLSSGLPASLSFAGDSNPPTISGTPDAATANTQLVYTVTDSSAAPLSVTLTFNIFVAAPPVLTQIDLTHTAGFALQDLPNAPILSEITSGGVAPISYAVGGLPANLAFDPASRVLTGTAAAAASFEITFTATDTNTAVATAIFTLQIDASLTFIEQVGTHQVRSGETYRVDPISLSLDPPLTLPASGGGDESLTGVLTGPAGDNDLGGLVLNSVTRILSGTLRSQDSGGDYVWTVTDGSGAFTTLTFTLRSAGPYFEDRTQQGDLTFVQGEQGSATLLEANTAQAQPDAASVVYTLTDPNGSPLSTILPGLAFDSATRALSGTPTAGKNPVALSYTATDGDGNTETLIFNVSIIASPLAFAGSVSDQGYVVNVPIATLNLPAAQDGIAPYNYALGGIPAGLNFDPNANPPTISGTPGDDTEGNYSLTYTVTDSAAGAPNTVSLIFNINIIPLIFVPATVADQTFTTGIPATLQLPVVNGGTSPYAYTLATLPAGLIFDGNANPPTLSGIPEDGTRGNYPLVYTVTDSNRPTNHTLSLNFTLTIIEGTAHFNILNRILLPEVARAVADQNIGAISQRISRVRTDHKSHDPANNLAQANLGGQDSWAGLLHSHGLTLLKGDQLNGRDILTKSNFVLPLNTKHLSHDQATEQQSFNFSLWGSGSYRDINGDSGGLDWEGELSGAHLGLDTLVGQQLLLGFAVSQSRSDLNYKLDRKSGSHQVDMTSLNPYFSWANESERLEVWGTIGFSQGELEIDDDNVTETASSDLDMFSLGAGLKGTLLTINNKLQLHLKGDALQAHLELEESEHIDALEINVSRLRVALEATGSFLLFGGSHLEPSLEMGLRHDGGDGEERNLLELALGLRHRLSDLGLILEARTHVLTGDHYSEYGAHASVQLQPNPIKGLFLNLSSGYGAEATPNIQEIWQRDLQQQDPISTTPQNLHHKARLSYNIPTNTSRHRTLLSSYTELTLDGKTTTNTLGLHWRLPSATLQLEWTNKQEEAPETEIKARFRF